MSFTSLELRSYYADLDQDGRAVGALVREQLAPEVWDRGPLAWRDEVALWITRVICHRWRLRVPEFEWVVFDDEDKLGEWDVERWHVALAEHLKTGAAVNVVATIAHELRHAVQDLTRAGEREHPLGDRMLEHWERAEDGYDSADFLNSLLNLLEIDADALEQGVRAGYG